MQPEKNGHHHMHRPKTYMLLKHRTLLLALVVGVVVFVFLTSGQLIAGNLLVSWNLGALAYIVLSSYRMLNSDVLQLKRRASQLDFSDIAMLVLAVTAAIASLGGIVVELLGVRSVPPHVAILKAGLALATLVVSWVFLHSLFAVHYTHRYYGNFATNAGLDFPVGHKEPIYWDFLYFSFTIGVASQTADVSVTSMAMRRLVLAHSVLSFFFNATVLALAINVGSSLL